MKGVAVVAMGFRPVLVVPFGPGPRPTAMAQGLGSEVFRVPLGVPVRMAVLMIQVKSPSDRNRTTAPVI